MPTTVLDDPNSAKKNPFEQDPVRYAGPGGGVTFLPHTLTGGQKAAMLAIATIVGGFGIALMIYTLGAPNPVTAGIGVGMFVIALAICLVAFVLDSPPPSGGATTSTTTSSAARGGRGGEADRRLALLGDVLVVADAVDAATSKVDDASEAMVLAKAINSVLAAQVRWLVEYQKGEISLRQLAKRLGATDPILDASISSSMDVAESAILDSLQDHGALSEPLLVGVDDPLAHMDSDVVGRLFDSDVRSKIHEILRLESDANGLPRHQSIDAQTALQAIASGRRAEFRTSDIRQMYTGVPALRRR